MPKCAGSSVRMIIPRAYPDFLIKTDDISFFSIPKNIRKAHVMSSLESPLLVPERCIVMGHFSPVKYLGKANQHRQSLFMFTFLRDPYDRLLSHYRYWRSGDFGNHYIWKKMRENNWSFQDFALSKEMRNLYCQYIEGISISHFDFIGIHEELDLSWKKLCSLTNACHVKLPMVNKTALNTAVQFDDSNELRKKVRSFHDEDYKIYNEAVSRLHS
jgi:hypothetical protein